MEKELTDIIEKIADDVYYGAIFPHVTDNTDMDDVSEMQKGIAEQITKSIPLINAVFEKQRKARIDHALKAQAELTEAYEERILKIKEPLKQIIDNSGFINIILNSHLSDLKATASIHKHTDAHLTEFVELQINKTKELIQAIDNIKKA